MIYPVLPQDNHPLIHIEKGRAIVARYVQTAPYTYTTQPASNWDALESEALAAVQDQVGAPEDGHYPCPPELATRAEWAE